MRRISAIVITTIFLTYHLGYYGIYLVMQYQIEAHWADKVANEELHPQDLLKISTPLSLPYRPDQKEYQPASGSMKVDGKFYRFIKYRYAKDTLHMVYVKDKKMDSLYSSLRDWAISFTNIPVSKNGTVELWKSMCKDFIIKISSGISKVLVLQRETTHNTGFLSFYNLYPEIPSPPPKSILA